LTPAPPRALFGLAVHSALPLPGLPAAGNDAPRVEVRYGPVPAQDGHLRATGDEALTLQIPEVGRFLVSGGDSIVIDPAPGAKERELRVYLLGSAFGALLHQRGLLPLHANCVQIGGRAVAFVGRSGAGKSTLAHWFQRHGHSVLADDVAAIAPLAEPPLALPGVPRLRLWLDALEAAGLDGGAYPRSFAGQDKFDVPAAATERRALPLGACYLLAEAGEGEPHGISRLTGIDASEALIANTYRGGFVTFLGRSEQHLQSCVAVARQVPLFRAVRRWGRDHYDEDASRLRDHAAALLGAAPDALATAAITG
jgi:hypothetical protein